MRPFLLSLMLAAIALRSVLGAPCCMEPLSAAEPTLGEHSAHSGHGAVGSHSGDHGDHSGDDPSANPCCSACGPTLPPDQPVLTARTAPMTLPEPAPVRTLATRPPFPAYEATGPPVLI
ncbi:MAG: hypothetical protein WBA51_01930 [Erythrobacter sp.]